MNQFSALICILCLVLINIQSVLAAGWTPPKDCANTTTTFERCVDRMTILSDESFVYPTNMKMMNARCKEARTVSACSQSYIKRCLQREVGNNVKLILYGIDKANRVYCSSTARKQSHIAFGSCANTNKKGILRAAERINRLWHGITIYPDVKLRLPLLCCAFFQFKIYLNEAVASCSEKAIAGLEHLAESYAGDGMNLLCGVYADDSDVCLKMVQKIPRWTGPLKRKVAFLTTVDILSSL